MTDTPQLDADVIIVGGGPAGATLACYLGMNGYKAIVLEREIHPREHVGESFVPSANPVLEEIEFFEKMDLYGFIRKPGATWTGPKGKVGAEAMIRFADAPLPEIAQDYTYHVDRARFDSLLLKHASDKGAQVVQGANVLKVNLDEAGRACGVRVRILDRELDLTSRFVVDGSGRRGLLGRQLKLMEKDPLFDQYAIYSWFRGVKQPAEDTETFIHIHFLPVRRGWVWQIPIYEGISSVGVVVEKETFRSSGKDHEVFFNELIQTSINTSYVMQDATRIRDFYVEGDYSYKMSRFAGDGWLLIGDAARFVDPIFSSGMSVAMKSAKFAFEAIRGTMSGDDERERFRAYNDKLAAGVAVWYEWIKIYYKLQSSFTRLGKNVEYRHQMQRLLQGEVFDPKAVEVLELMKKAVKEIEETEGHLMKDLLDPAISID